MGTGLGEVDGVKVLNLIITCALAHVARARIQTNNAIFLIKLSSFLVEFLSPPCDAYPISAAMASVACS